jgi:Protein of unknown function (DUF5672)
MKDVTLVAIEWQWYDLTRYAIERSLEHIDAKEVVVISDREILPGARHIITPPVNGMSEYANVMLKGTAEHVNTGHALYVQWDGIANDKQQWTDEFLNYDYIGAPWPWEKEGYNIGNGGFSLRSRRLLDACQDPQVTLTDKIAVAEDAIIGGVKRDYLEQQYGIKFAPTQLARQFSFELGEHVPSFGFHGLWNIFNLMSDADLDYFHTRINYAGWNVYKWHHTLAAVIRRNRMDIYQYMLDQLIEHNIEFLNYLAQWLEQDSQTKTDKLIIV